MYKYASELRADELDRSYELGVKRRAFFVEKWALDIAILEQMNWTQIQKFNYKQIIKTSKYINLQFRIN
jgi:hypothetical protein